MRALTTPKCWPTHCPAVLENGTDLVIVGSKMNIGALPPTHGVADHEAVVSIDRAMVEEALGIPGMMQELRELRAALVKTRSRNHLADLRREAVDLCVKEDIIA
jgi:hypothetical protein